MTDLIRLDRVGMTYTTASGTVEALRDIDLAVGQFFGLLKGPWHTQAACGGLCQLNRTTRAKIVCGAVRMFLLAYGPKSACAELGGDSPAAPVGVCSAAEGPERGVGTASISKI